MAWFFLFFSLSGFCSILYELVWLRLSMAQFGVTSAQVSIVLSVFMAGLGLGSWASGRALQKRNVSAATALRLYALTELCIACAALLVPRELALGRHLLQHLPLSSSAEFYFASGTWLAFALVPWCACMGATIPLGMQAIRRGYAGESPRAFSFLYLANVLGAVAGAFIPLLFIEAYGFHGALHIGAIANGLLFVGAVLLSLRSTPDLPEAAQEVSVTKGAVPRASLRLLVLLFGTGLTSMGMEIVWVREFTPYLSTVVYAFAAILGTYLLFTFFGSRIYRRWSLSHTKESAATWMWLGVTALLPLISASPKIHTTTTVRLLLGVAPFSTMLGFLTPMLVDRWSGGDPDRAGSAYAVNVAGCILGPLLSGFVLLPWISERWALLMFALPWLFIGISAAFAPTDVRVHRSGLWNNPWLAGVVTLLLIVFGRDFESRFKHKEVRRDNTATLIATGEDMDRQLYVNGISITSLDPVTKMMAHLPLAFLDHAPRNALTICFGMGTTYRSLLSWHIPTTAVELAPSVPKLFGYFHSDAPQILRSPLSHVVIDDGRRYLERTSDQYDVIAIDPPPPVEAAGSSLLYSKEFYTTLKQHLRPDGILQQWLPEGDSVDRSAIARALQESFPYVRVFVEDPEEHWGIHFLASMQPLHNWTAVELAQHMPDSAAKDLIEWGPESNAADQFVDLLQNEISLQEMIALAPGTPALQDDRPVNEYYLLRRRIRPRLRRMF